MGGVIVALVIPDNYIYFFGGAVAMFLFMSIVAWFFYQGSEK